MLLGALADDLTGAADVVAPFASRVRAGVGVDFGDVVAGGAWEVWAWNTETRGLEDHSQVAHRVQRATEQLLRSEPKIVFKKIDSTLRGNLAWELAALQTLLPSRTPLVCPAFPAMGRTVREGRLHIHGTCWTETEFAPKSGITRVSEAFGWQFENAFFPDAETENDMIALAQRVLQEPRRWIVVGSAGLSRAIAHQLEIAPKMTIDSFKDRTLVVIGSRHGRSREQVDHFCQVREAPRLWLDSHLSRAEIVAQVRALWERGAREIVLQTPNDTQDDSPNAMLKRVITALYFQECPFDTIFATGGDTAYHILKAMGATHLRVLGEREAGVVVSVLRLQSGDPLTLITKAGGFGDQGTLVRCLAREEFE